MSGTDDPPAATNDDAQAERVARIEAVYRQLPVTLLASGANALLTAGVLARELPSFGLLLWLCAVALVSGLRLVLCRRFWRDGQDHAAPRWAGWSVIGALLAGGLWGMLCVVLVPPEQPYPVFVAFVVGGMCAGAATFNAPHPPTAAAFVLSSVLPLAAYFAARGDRFDIAMASMSLIFAITMIITSRSFARFFGESVRTRLDLARRTEALSKANAHLRLEVDERHAAEAALRHAQKMEAIGNLTAGVAHDFNNILMAIGGSAELLRSRQPILPQDAALIDAIALATDRGARLTRHLLAFARKEALDPAVVDPNAVLIALNPLLTATLGRSVRVVLGLQDAVWPIYVDRNEIERAVINLAINARDAMPDGGTVTLATRNLAMPPPLPDGALRVPCVAITVRDTGTGMPAAVRERAFEPFFTTKPTGRGSGLGLSQVYGMVKQSGGATVIDSAPGAGTAVWLYLPRASEEALQRAPPAAPRPLPAAAAIAEGHVVVLDDEVLIVDAVGGLLRRAGYRVSGFVSASEALQSLHHDASVMLLLTDLDMPDCRGDEVARQVRALRPRLPVVFMTGYNNAKRLGDEPWQLHKPFTEAELLEILRQALVRAAASP